MAGATMTRSASGTTTSMARHTSATTQAAAVAFKGKAFIVMGDQNSDPRRWRQPQRRHPRAARSSARERKLRHRRATARSRRAPRRAARISRIAATRASTPRTSTTASPATCAWTIYCRRKSCTSAPVACSGRRSPTPAAALVWGDRPAPSSDHRLVWLDVTAGGARCPPGSDPTASEPSRPRH